MPWRDSEIEDDGPHEKTQIARMRITVENLFKKVVIAEVDKRDVTLTPEECGLVKDLIVVVKKLWE